MDFAFLYNFTSPIIDNPVAQTAIAAVLILIVLDIVFGLANAVLHKEYRSERMRIGIGHKCAELGFILVGVVVDGTVIAGLDLGFSAPVLVTICIYLCLMEIGSLLETFALLNPELADSALFKILHSTKLTQSVDERRDDGTD